jgi:ketosteroid isomerase-like protein
VRFLRSHDEIVPFTATVCEQRWVSGQELLFDARRVTTIVFSEGRATHNSWQSVTMNDLTTREPANDPQDLERLLVARENAGDVTGMTALFEPDAVVDIGGGTFLRGKEAIHEFFTKLQVTGFGPEKRKFEFGEQRPALICGDLVLTSTRSRNGTVTSEVARRQKDGTWLWVIDRYSVSW